MDNKCLGAKGEVCGVAALEYLRACGQASDLRACVELRSEAIVREASILFFASKELR